jgi:hypothetical protein
MALAAGDANVSGCYLYGAANAISSRFRLGNEQYNANFASQVQAMEARAKALKLPQQSFSYLWPQGPGDSPGRKDFAPNAADAQAINALGLGSHILSDIHGPSMGGVTKAKQVFAEPATSGWVRSKVAFTSAVTHLSDGGLLCQGAMNLETNCGDHTMHRALTEGRDLNLFFRFPNPALKGRAASFCMERSGYNEGFANDQVCPNPGAMTYSVLNAATIRICGVVARMFPTSAPALPLLLAGPCLLLAKYDMASASRSCTCDDLPKLAATRSEFLSLVGLSD